MLQVIFIMTYIIHKISILLKATRILKHFLRNIIAFYLKYIYIFKKPNHFFFSEHIMMKSSWLEEEDKNIEENVI